MAYTWQSFDMYVDITFAMVWHKYGVQRIEYVSTSSHSQKANLDNAILKRDWNIHATHVSCIW